jgi:hypothetical protein
VVKALIKAIVWLFDTITNKKNSNKSEVAILEECRYITNKISKVSGEVDTIVKNISDQNVKNSEEFHRISDELGNIRDRLHILDTEVIEMRKVQQRYVKKVDENTEKIKKD